MRDRKNRGSRRGAGRALALAALLLPAWGAALAQLQPVNLQAGDRVDGVAIVLTRLGPYPNAFTHAATPFLLSIVNRSGVLEDTFSLVAAGKGAANSFLDLHSTALRQRDHQIVKPLPGNYQLLFKAHPDWVVNITITGN
jgi:hypothetical protein